MGRITEKCRKREISGCWDGKKIRFWGNSVAFVDGYGHHRRAVGIYPYGWVWCFLKIGSKL